MPPPPTSYAMQESYSLPSYHQPDNKSNEAFFASTTSIHGEEIKSPMGPRSNSDHFNYNNNISNSTKISNSALITSSMIRAKSTDPNTHCKFGDAIKRETKLYVVRRSAVSLTDLLCALSKQTCCLLSIRTNHIHGLVVCRTHHTQQETRETK
jgi:hypothetical protein